MSIADRLPVPARARLRVLALGVTLLLASAGGRPAVGQRSMQFRHLGVDELRWVQAIVQDSRGFMWFGTANGLVRYDGYGYRAFRHTRTDTTSIANHSINELYEDRDSVLWVGTRVGLSRFDRATERFRNYPLDGGVIAIREDERGTLWAGTVNAVYRFDRNAGVASVVALPLPAEAPRAYSQLIFEDSRKHLWVGTRGQGLFERDPATGRFVRHASVAGDPNTLPSNDIRAMAEDANGQLWIGTYTAGLVRLDPSTGRMTHYAHDPANPNSPTNNVIARLLLDGQGGLWIGTENGGLDHFDPMTGVFAHHRSDPGDPTGLTNNSIWSLCIDDGGSLWVGTFAGGVNIAKQNSEGIRSFRSVMGDQGSLSSNSVLGFAQDLQGNAWIATDGGGLNRLDAATGRFTRYTTANSNLDQDAVLALVTTRDGAIWLGTWNGGISRFDPATNSFTAYTTRNSNLPDDHVFSIYEDRVGRLWVGTWRQGLALFDRARNTFTHYNIAPPGTGESDIWVIRELSDGTLALATLENGLALFNPATGKATLLRSALRDDNTLSSDEVRALLETQPGILWVGTANGLDRLDLRSHAITHLLESDGLPSAGISGLVLDASGKMWISTEQGLVRYDLSTKHMDYYTVADGLQGNAFAPRSYLQARDGTLYFGSNSGFTVIRPDRIQRNEHKPRVVITDFQLSNRPVAIGVKGSPLKVAIGMTPELRLSHSQNVFSFQFAALDYATPEKNEYAYMLQGFDKDWHRVGSVRMASYTGLPRGSMSSASRPPTGTGSGTTRAPPCASWSSPRSGRPGGSG